MIIKSNKNLFIIFLKFYESQASGAQCFDHKIICANAQQFQTSK